MVCEDIDHRECTDHVVDIKEKGKGINTGGFPFLFYFPINFFREGDVRVVLIFQSTSQTYSPYPSFSISAFGMKRKDAEFMQYLKPVGLGPS